MTSRRAARQGLSPYMQRGSGICRKLGCLAQPKRGGARNQATLVHKAWQNIHVQCSISDKAFHKLP